MYSGLHIKYPLYLFHFNANFSQQIDGKYSNPTFHENSSSGSQVVPCGQTDGKADRHDEAKSLFAILRKRIKISFSSSLFLGVKLPHLQKNRVSESDKIVW
jgi:hypothetical protein